MTDYTTPIILLSSDGVKIGYPRHHLQKLCGSISDLLGAGCDETEVPLDFTEKEIRLFLDFLLQFVLPDTLDEILPVLKLADYLDLSLVSLKRDNFRSLLAKITESVIKEQETRQKLGEYRLPTSVSWLLREATIYSWRELVILAENVKKCNEEYIRKMEEEIEKGVVDSVPEMVEGNCKYTQCGNRVVNSFYGYCNGCLLKKSVRVELARLEWERQANNE
jgi:hypothetical protein